METGDENNGKGSESDATTEMADKRIQFLRSVLNAYRGRVLSLSLACESRSSRITAPENAENYEFLRKQINGLQNSITLLKNIEEAVDAIHNNITFLTLSEVTNTQLLRELQRTVLEITYFSKSVIRLYNEYINEMENIGRKRDYSSELIKFQKHLNSLKEQQAHYSETEEEIRRIKKAESQVNKINFIREMKMILIGKFAGNSEKFPHLQQFRTPYRKKLTIDDFNETWNVGLE